jgi:hypothetical protein
MPKGSVSRITITAPMLQFTISEAILETWSEGSTVGTGILAIEPTVTFGKAEGFCDFSVLIFTVLASKYILYLT